MTSLAEHLSNISKGSSIKSFCTIKEKEEKNPIDFKTDQYYPYNENFTMDELLSALSSCSNTAPGEDMITFEMLKYLHPNILKYLLKLYRKIWTEIYFPQAWQKALDLPSLKPDKDPFDLNSYRPIALTSCLCKLFEMMINNRLTWYLEKTGYFSALVSI